MYNGTIATCFTNGVLCKSGNIAAVKDNGMVLRMGDRLQYDEIRLRGGSLSAARIKADYDMIKNRNFLTYGPVESGRWAE